MYNWVNIRLKGNMFDVLLLSYINICESIGKIFVL